jgi:cardiolipin synthase
MRIHPVPLSIVLAAISCLSTCGLAPVSGPVAPAGTGSPPAGLIVGPDDGTGAILNAMSTARRSVLLEMYMLTAPAALMALLSAHDAGCQVRVLLEPAPYGDATANQFAFSTLAAAGIDVRWFNVRGGLVHAKLLLIDGVTAYILTLNLTAAGLAGNREYAVADANPADVGWATAIWNADAIGADAGLVPPDTRLVVSPINARARLGAAIDGARTSITIEIEEISDDDFVTRLVRARARGITVTVVTPAENMSAGTILALARMASAGITVRELASPVVHAKAMVIDGRRFYVGSVNFTRASLDDNREFGMLSDDAVGAVAAADAVGAARIATTIAADAARGRPP